MSSNKKQQQSIERRIITGIGRALWWLITLLFKFGENTDDPVKMYLEDVYTVPVNIAGIPAISIPVGTADEDGKTLPIGMQILGAQKSDYQVFDIAKQIENIIKGEK